MKTATTSVHVSLERRQTAVIRARSLPHPHLFRVALLWACIHYLVLIGTLTTMVVFVQRPHLTISLIMIGMVVLSVVTWVISRFARGAARCPLCKGSPLLDTGARAHADSFRLLPFNYGTTATLSTLCCQKFRCMYCGSKYDMLKPPSGRKDYETYPDNGR